MCKTLAALSTLLMLVACEDTRAPERESALEANWKVVATSAGDRKIAAIKAIREVTGIARIPHRRPYYDADNGALDCVARQATILNVHSEHACGRRPRAPCQTAILAFS